MDFLLHYRGPLKAKGGIKHKFALRRHFHRQLSVLWNQKPLLSFRSRFLEPGGEIGISRPITEIGRMPVAPPPGGDDFSVITQVGKFTFAPLVCTKLGLIAELDVVLLWPHEPGHLITSGGDLDNRVKTLLDSLRMPQDVQEIPKGEQPSPDEGVFFCLLEDDSLVTRLNVGSRQLLEPDVNESDVDLSISVTTKQTHVMYATLGLS